MSFKIKKVTAPPAPEDLEPNVLYAVAVGSETFSLIFADEDGEGARILGAGASDVDADDIQDATIVGKALIRAADKAAGRDAIDAAFKDIDLTNAAAVKTLPATGVDTVPVRAQQMRNLLRYLLERFNTSTNRALDAEQAVQLSTARTIQINLGSGSGVNFNGTANVTPGVFGTLPIAFGGTGATNAISALAALGGLGANSPSTSGSFQHDGNLSGISDTSVIAGFKLVEKSESINTSPNPLSIGNNEAGYYFGTFTSGSKTINIVSSQASGRVDTFMLEMTNGGLTTITWGSMVQWDAGTPPVLQTAGVDIVAFVTRDGGTTFRGTHLFSRAS